jgi:protein-S-isoprenylcysteine O-methyltransferase Ste14
VRPIIDLSLRKTITVGYRVIDRCPLHDGVAQYEAPAMTSPDRGPRVFVPPPIVFLAGWALGWGLNRRLPFAIDGAGASPAQIVVSFVVLAAGAALAAWGAATFRRAGTAIVPVQPASALVSGGPYRFTRNPMYLGLTIAYLGLAGVTNMAWPIVLLPLVLIVLATAVIEKEEGYLRATFGADYDAYCARVRRWL